MKKQLVRQWFKELEKAWSSKNISEIKDILSSKFIYYEHPFEKPFTTWSQVEKAWQEIKNQKIIKLSINPLIYKNLNGSASYHLKYKDNYGNLHESLGAYYVKLNRDGRAKEFRQWWVSK